MKFRESLKFVMDSKELLGRTFYEVLFERYPEMQPYFAGVDMRRQSLVVTMALMLVERYHRTSFLATERFLQFLGTHHKKRGVTPDLYPNWIAAMLETLGRFHGEQWNGELEYEWQRALQKAADKMLEGYTTEFEI